MAEAGLEQQRGTSSIIALQEKTGRKISQIRSRIIDVASLSQYDPSRQEKALAVMSSVEAFRQELGIACVTIGVGKDRAILFTHPVERSADQRIDITGDSVAGYVLKQSGDIGTFHTRYNDYLFLNRQGVGKLSIVTDQNVELNLNSSIFATDRTIEFPGIVSHFQSWGERHRQYVKWNGSRTEEALRKIISDGDFLKKPNRRDSQYINKYDKFKLAQLMYQVGQDISPASPVSALSIWRWKKATDVNFDGMSKPSDFSEGYISVRVTKADFISQAVKSHTPETTLSQTTPEENIPLSEKSIIGYALNDYALKEFGEKADQFKLSGALKLSDDSDKTLLKYYLVQRMLRTLIYNKSYFINENEREKRILKDIEEETQEFLEDNYVTEEKRRHARTIELAVNELVARATTNTEWAEVVLTEPLVAEWGERWANRFSNANP